jgi:hypothetical protein
MATTVTKPARRHVANMVEKTNRWVEALEAGESLGVPRALLDLEAAGPMGKATADIAWTALANAVGAYFGKDEKAPETTRQAIAQRCDQRAEALARPLMSAEELTSAIFGGLPR